MLMLINNVWEFLPMNDLMDNIIDYGFILMLFIMLNRLQYFVIEKLMEKYMNNYDLLENYQIKYIVKNLTKSATLLIILMLSAPSIYSIINGIWINKPLWILGSLYVSTDLTGLIFVPKLPKPTRIHHTIVGIFGLCNISVDYTKNGLHRALFVLCILSAVPYLVNTYLGLRYLENNNVQRKIVDICLFTYANSVIANVIFQYLYIFKWTTFHYVSVIYFVLYNLILYDDIKLIKYLYHKYKNQ